MNRAVIVSVVCLALALLGLRRVEVEQTADETARRANINAIRVAAMRVDTLAMSVRAGSSESYDPLVTAVTELRRAVRSASDDGDSVRTAALAALRTLVSERTLQIEEMKGRRSTLHNSERALLHLLDDPDVFVDPELRSALLDFLLSRTPATEDKLVAEALRVSALADPSAKLVARHAQVVLEGRRLLEDSAARFLSAALSDAATHLAVAAENDGITQRLRLAELALLLALLLVGLIGAWRP